MNNSNLPVRTPEEELEIRRAGFAWDLVVQIAALRESRGLSQGELARLIGTKQQAISRLEDPEYDGHSLRKLRDVANALDAFVDVVFVPHERANIYFDWRYQPVLDKEPPYKWEELVPGTGKSIEVPVTAVKQQPGWYSALPWRDLGGTPGSDTASSGRVEIGELKPKEVAA